MGEPRMYTVAEVNKLIKLEPHMIEFYVKQFAEFFEIKKDEKGTRLFTENDVVCLIEIKKLIRENGPNFRKVKHALLEAVKLGEVETIENTEEQGIVSAGNIQKVVRSREENFVINLLRYLTKEVQRLREENRKIKQVVAKIPNMQQQIYELQEQIQKQAIEQQRLQEQYTSGSISAIAWVKNRVNLILQKVSRNADSQL